MYEYISFSREMETIRITQKYVNLLKNTTSEIILLRSSSVYLTELIKKINELKIYLSILHDFVTLQTSHSKILVHLLTYTDLPYVGTFYYTIVFFTTFLMLPPISLEKLLSIWKLSSSW